MFLSIQDALVRLLVPVLLHDDGHSHDLLSRHVGSRLFGLEVVVERRLGHNDRAIFKLERAHHPNLTASFNRGALADVVFSRKCLRLSQIIENGQCFLR